MEKLNLPPIKKRMSQNEILNAWRKFYKKKHGISESENISDSKILEQFALEYHRGSLQSYLLLSVTPNAKVYPSS